MDHVDFDTAFREFCTTYDRLWVPTVKGGICNISAFYPGPNLSPPREHIKVSASIKEVLDMIPDDFMGWPIIKNIVK